MTCEICYNPFNRTTRAEVKCQYCQFAACKECCKTYILDRSSSICMNPENREDGTPVCQQTWTRKFVCDNFQSVWVNDAWEKMIKKNVVDRERALLPETMPYAAHKKRMIGFDERIRQAELAILQLKRERLNESRVGEALGRGQVPIISKSYSARKCSNETCRGFLNEKWKCEICQKDTCKSCRRIVDTEVPQSKPCAAAAPPPTAPVHECNPDDVATAKLLDRDTKNCPSCSTPIFKISGCDQMWCIQCHVAFSWKTGLIEKKIHNPHFFEWQRQNNGGVAPRVEGDPGPQGGCRNVEFVTGDLYQKILKFRRSCTSRLAESPHLINEVVRGIIHLQLVHLPYFTRHLDPKSLENRVNFLTEKITEVQFERNCAMTAKASAKNRDICDVIELQIQGLTDIVYRMDLVVPPREPISDLKAPDEDSDYIGRLEQLYSEMEALTAYSNELLKDHSKTYGCKSYQLLVTPAEATGNVIV
jgi:hypothetical protein